MYKTAEKLFNVIGSLLGMSNGAAKPAPERFIPVTEQLRQEARRREPINELSIIPRYPPFDHGLPALSVDLILKTQEEMVRRIKLQAGLHESEYQRLFVPVQENYAKYVHLLPATKDDYHRGAGGLFRMGLEVGFFSLQSSSGVIFTGRETAGMRRIQEPRWRYVTFVAGMCYEIYRVLTQMIVTTENGEQWPCYTSTLQDWLQSKGAERYFITWVENGVNAASSQHAASFVINRILPEACVQYIAEAGNDLVPVLMSVVTGSTSRSYADPVYEIVTRSHAGVIDHDRKTNPAAYGKVMVGSHLERYLIDAVRKLVREQWHVNQKKARCWYSNEGVFVIWQSGAKDVWELLQRQKLPGVPEAPETLAEIMVSSGMILPNDDGDPFWTIYPPNTSSPEGYRAVKFRNKELIFDHVLLHGADASDGIGKQNPVAPVEVSLLSPPAREEKPAKNAGGQQGKKKQKSEQPAAQAAEATPTATAAPVAEPPAAEPPSAAAPRAPEQAPTAAAGSVPQNSEPVIDLPPAPEDEMASVRPADAPPPGPEDAVPKAKAEEQGGAGEKPGAAPGKAQADNGKAQKQSPPRASGKPAQAAPAAPKEDFRDVLPNLDEDMAPAPRKVGAEAIFEQLGDTARYMVEAIRDDFNANKCAKSIFVCKDGIAITSLEIGTRGIAKAVMDELLAKGVLVKNEKGTALHKITRASETASCALFNLQYAQKVGFKV